MINFYILLLKFDYKETNYKYVFQIKTCEILDKSFTDLVPKSVLIFLVFDHLFSFRHVAIGDKGKHFETFLQPKLPQNLAVYSIFDEVILEKVIRFTIRGHCHVLKFAEK